MIQFKITYPMESIIYGDSFKEAVKNYIKLNHNLDITRMIIQDKSRNMEAQIKYYQQDGRNKVGINMFPVGYQYPYSYPIVSNNTYIPPQLSNPLLNPPAFLESPSLVNSLIPLSPTLSPVLSTPFIPTVINIPKV